MDKNELTSLPATLTLVALQRLSLRRNCLSSASTVDGFLAPPRSCPTLSALGKGGPPGSLPLALSIRELNLSSNGLEHVPGSIFACRGLQVGCVLTLGVGLSSGAPPAWTCRECGV